jgi:hypothetical protein
MCIAFLLLASIASPGFAQSTSGASSAMTVINPANTTSNTRLVTTPTVVAPGLAAAGIETCLGSASGGLSVMGGGFSFGRTMIDEGCTIRLLARQLYAFGLQKAAMALMCQDERVIVAMEAVGTPCPSARGEDMDQVQITSMRPFTSEEQGWFDRQSKPPR